jgi:hypothetical protein
MDVPNDVVAHVVQVSNLDRDHVERVCAKLNNDRDAISRAVDQFFNGSGAFVEGKQEDGWVERKKDKIRKVLVSQFALYPCTGPLHLVLKSRYILGWR